MISVSEFSETFSYFAFLLGLIWYIAHLYSTEICDFHQQRTRMVFCCFCYSLCCVLSLLFFVLVLGFELRARAC
jgi:hypothetical protein